MAESLSANRQRLRKWRADNPDLNRAKNAHYRSVNPEKVAAHKKVELAIKAGTLIRQPCERCGTEHSVHAHHEDYGAPLTVNWLCQMHHRQRHREIDGLPEPTRRQENPVRQARVQSEFGKGITHADGCFRLRLIVFGKTKNFGSFSVLEEAIAARDAALATIAVGPASVTASPDHPVAGDDLGAVDERSVGQFVRNLGAPHVTRG